MRACIHDETYCRYGGDEFIIFGADYTNEKAEALTNDIRSRIANLNDSGSNPFKLSASIGYVIDVPEKGQELFDFVNKADKAMYEEKKSKKLHK
jgi:diguanylate cyclase (GGDEF)-like protein